MEKLVTREALLTSVISAMPRRIIYMEEFSFICSLTAMEKNKNQPKKDIKP